MPAILCPPWCRLTEKRPRLQLADGFQGVRCGTGTVLCRTIVGTATWRKSRWTDPGYAMEHIRTAANQGLSFFDSELSSCMTALPLEFLELKCRFSRFGIAGDGLEGKLTRRNHSSILAA